MNILQRYILRELTAPVVLSILFFTVLLLLGQIFRMAELLLMARVDWTTMFELVGIVALSLTVLTIPMAVLLGTLLGVGRMTGENEILAMRVGGLSLGRVFWPYFLVMGVFSGGLMYANWSLLPALVQRLSDRQTELQFRILTNLEPGRTYDELAPRGTDLNLYFNERLPRQPGDGDYVLRMGKVALRVVGDASRLTGARLTTEKRGGADQLVEAPRETVFFAREGVIKGNIKDRSVEIALSDGTIMLVNPLMLERETGTPVRRESRERETVLQFERVSQTLHPRTEGSGAQGYDPRALRVEQLMTMTVEEPEGPIREQSGRNRVTEDWRVYLSARNELYQRMTLPFSLLAFSLIAVPLAVQLRPRARTMSFLLSVAVILVYYMLNSLATAVGMSNSPFTLPLFILPNVLIGGAGLIMFRRL